MLGGPVIRNVPIFGSFPPLDFLHFAQSYSLVLCSEEFLMDLEEHLARARAAHKTQAAKRRAAQMFELAWRSSSPEYIVGWELVAKRLGIKEATLRSRLSSGGGKYSCKRVNPVTGELDILDVRRREVISVQPKRGRPAKFIDRQRLGIEYEDAEPLQRARDLPQKIPNYLQKMSLPKPERRLPKIKPINVGYSSRYHPEDSNIDNPYENYAPRKPKTREK